jgi:hypothetical protein
VVVEVAVVVVVVTAVGRVTTEMVGAAGAVARERDVPPPADNPLPPERELPRLLEVCGARTPTKTFKATHKMAVEVTTKYLTVGLTEKRF